VTDRVSFRFEGRDLLGVEGRSVAAALHAAGVTTLGWSAKYRRPRGLRCVRGHCPCCTMLIDGQVAAACTTPLAGGEHVVRLRPRLPRLPIDRLAPLLPAGFYYDRLRRSPRIWRHAERALAHLAATRTLAPGAIADIAQQTVDVLIVGGGRHGLQHATEAAQRGEVVLVAEREARLGGRLLDRPHGANHAHRLVTTATAAGAELLTNATVLGSFDEGITPVATPQRLLLVRARRIEYATGTLDRDAPLPGGDRPGVFLAGGAARLTIRDGVLPGASIILAHADGIADDITPILTNHGATIIDHCAVTDITAVHGSPHLHAITRRRASRTVRIRCDTLIISAGHHPLDTLERLEFTTAARAGVRAPI